MSAKPLSETARLTLALFRERQIRPAGVLSGESPGGLAVPSQVNDRKLFVHRDLHTRFYWIVVRIRLSDHCKSTSENETMNRECTHRIPFLSRAREQAVFRNS